jgi:sulfur relay (sulfurtransferase) complex TusBCD TusD component (DsrE family)
MRKGVERCSALDVHKAQVTVCVWARDRRGVRRRAGAAGLDDDRRTARLRGWLAMTRSQIVHRGRR